MSDGLTHLQCLPPFAQLFYHFALKGSINADSDIYVEKLQLSVSVGALYGVPLIINANLLGEKGA
jgi:hypothetical protein